MVFRWFRRKAQPDGVRASVKDAAEPKTRAELRDAIEAVHQPSQQETRTVVEDASIDVARHRFIVFRKIFPPPPNPGLSFYGGAPVGPPGMEWSRGGEEERPLTFVMQWDLAALAAEDATGLLPQHGALYFFCSFGREQGKAFRFVYVGGNGQDWAPLPVPDNLPPVFGEAAGELSPLAASQVPAERRHAPRLLPRWPFVPVGIDYTKSMEGDDANGEGRRFWTEGPELSAALLRAQDPLGAPLAARSSKPAFQRPFPAFPYDWAAVRFVAAKSLKRLEYVSPASWERFKPETGTAARAALTATWRQSALALYDEAVAFPASAAVPRQRADAIWALIEQWQLIFWPSFNYVVDEAVNLSFGLGSAAASVIPAEYVEACAQCHRLATLTIRKENEPEFKANRGLDLPWKEISAAYKQAKEADELRTVRDIWAPPPNRMFGPPRYVQGDVEELVDEWLLLLELSSSDANGWSMGDGVLQFLIRPEDLRTRRFDRVEAIATGY